MLKRLLRSLLSFLPRKLPIGRADFDSWVEEIVYLSGLPDNDTTRFAAAQIIFQIRPSIGYMPLRYAVNQLIKAAANRVAKDVIAEQQKQHEQQQ